MNDNQTSLTNNGRETLMGELDSCEDGKGLYDHEAFSQVPKVKFNEYKKAFVLYDKDKIGLVKTINMKFVLRRLASTQLEEKEIKKIISSCDPSKKGSISFSKFVNVMENLRKQKEAVEETFEVDDKKKAFSLFEVSGTEMMKVASLKNALDYLGYTLTPEKLADLTRNFGETDDGTMSYEKFCTVVAALENPESMPFCVSDRRRAEIEEIFELFKVDETGLMKTSELGFGIRCIGITLDVEEVKDLMISEGLHEEEFLSKAKFFQVMEMMMQKHNLEQDASKLSDEEIRELQDAFSLFDNDGDGNVTVTELGSVMKSLGRNMSHKKLKELVEIADTDGNGTLDFQELLDFIEKDSIRCSFLDEMKKAFCHFDKDGDGYISPIELKKALARMKIKLSKVEFVLMLKRVDTDKDGQVSFKEFVIMMINDNT